MHRGGELLERFNPRARERLLLGDCELAAVAADERDGPRHQGGDLGLEPDEVYEVQNQPGQPCNDPAELQWADLCDRAVPRHSRHRTLVEILERLALCRVRALEL